MNDKPHLRLLEDAKAKKTAEEAKAEATKKRAQSKHDFYVKARVNPIVIEKLKEALLASALVDENGEAIMPWTEKLIQELIDGVDDPGPKNKNRDT